MSELISEWRSQEVEVSPEQVLDENIDLKEIRDEVGKMSEAQKKNFLYRILSQTHDKGKKRTKDDLSSAICSTVRILRHYEKLKEQRSKLGVEDGEIA